MPKKKELTAQEWREEIDHGLRYRRDYGMEDAWASLEAVFYSADSKNRAAAGPNLIASNGDSFISALSVSYPYLNIRPRRREFVKWAPVLESVDNWLMKELRVAKALERAILHAFLWGKGIVKIGYDSEFGYDPHRDIGGDQPLGMTLSQFDQRGRLIEPGRTDPGMPWVLAVPPHDIVVPWGTVDIEDAAWVAHRIVRHIDEVRSDDKYKNHRDLEPSISQEDYTRSYTTTKQLHRVGMSSMRSTHRGSVEYLEMFEIHNRRDRTIKVIATGHERILRDVPNELQLDGLPFIDLSFTPRARSFWTTPDAYYLKNPQAEIDDISLQASIQRRITKLKFLYEEGAIDEEELQKAISADGYMGIKVNSSSNIKDSIAVMHNENMSSLYQDAEIIHSNAREVLGLSKNQHGEFQGGRTTAAEVKTVDKSTLRRMGRRQGNLRTAYEDVFRKINQIIFKFWTQPRITEFVGEEGAKEWMEFTGSQLRGEYQYEAVFSDEILPTETQEENDALQMYTTLAQSPGVNLPALNDYMVNKNNNPGFKRIFRGDQDANVQLPVSKV